MLKINRSLVLLLLVLFAMSQKSFGQMDRKRKMDRVAAFSVFDKDSLAGFDEEAARKMAVSTQYLGSELNIKMYQMKRYYINDKYQLWPKFTPAPYAPESVERTTVVPGCTNEDFEAATSGTIGSNNAISGWGLSSGNNLTAVGNQSVNSCNLLGCCNGVTSESAIRTTPFIDPIIGTQYPIYSVFGTSTINATAGAAANPQLTLPLFGNKVIRINDSVNDFSIEKLSKTFSVTASNALFQFAFISVFATGHDCCDAGSFRIRLYNASSNNSLIPCPTFSVSAPGPECTPGAGTPNYLEAAASSGNAAGGATVTANSSYIYNPWQISSIDLTPYIGSNITIEIILTDCTAGGHYGYCYFDAQCGPMTIYGNGMPFAAGNTTATVPTCGASGATICAASGLGPYSWAGPGVGPPYTTSSMANQCFTTSLSGTFTLYMNPAGSCNPITRVITSTVTPAPLLFASVVQAVCGSTAAVVTLTPSGSAASPSQITFSPIPLSYGGGSLNATYTIPTGTNAPLHVTVTATDPQGCVVTATTNVNSAAPFPTFTITNVTGSTDITCTHSLVEIKAITNYTYGVLNYTWTSQNTYSVSDDIGVYSAGTFTVVGMDPVSLCSVTHTYALGTNTTAPVGNITPTLQNISCTSSITPVIATSITTLNITQNFISPGLIMSSNTASTTTYIPGGPGTYTYLLVDNNNGCSTMKTFTVTSNDQFPTLSVSSVDNFTVGCGIGYNLANVTLFAQGAGGVSYTIVPAIPTPTNPPLGGVLQYTFTTPGNYVAFAKDLSSQCETSVPFSIIAFTTTPNIGAIIPETVLSCATPSTVLTGVTTNSHVSYTWAYPSPNGALSVNNSTVQVTTSPTLGINLPTYTLTIKDIDNGCVSTKTVQLQQSISSPSAHISGGSVNNATSAAVTCATQSVNLNNGSTTTIPQSLPHSGPVSVVAWQGPSPQQSVSVLTNYQAYTPGTYTLEVMDENNGCVSSATFLVTDGRQYPTFDPAGVYSYTLGCGPNVLIASSVINPPAGLIYSWSHPSYIPGDPATNSATYMASAAAEYNLMVKNPANGCSSSKSYDVINGFLTADFTPDQTSGFAPLTVSFANNSHSTNNLNITTVWSFGNGTSIQTSAANISPTATYTQSGTYTVTIYTSKGAGCQDTAVRVITVDIPSELEIPNVFTPNDDGVNDFFFLKTSNLSEITAVIYDRWGHKVYEITSETGNISWDGKNMTGSKVAAGVYFYTIKGKGKDDKDYNNKGTVTLFK